MTNKKDTNTTTTCFTHFKAAIDTYTLPDRFTFPFYYDPHPLSVLAAKELQDHIQTQTEWDHNFGIDPNKEGLIIGKMFGVLVVQNEAQELGYLAAFSGKLAGKNHHAQFVPPVFDMLTPNSFFRQEEAVLNALNRQLEILEADPNYLKCKADTEAAITKGNNILQEYKQEMKAAKKDRKKRRQKAEKELTPSNFLEYNETLRQESLKYNYYFKDLSKYWKNTFAEKEAALAKYTDQIAAVKQERKAKSSALQQKLFNQYQFLNQAGVSMGLCEIFEPTITKKPPAGAGECAAPKLLQYAFLHQLKPIAMAEFWWGQSPKSEIRKHAHFYPACRGKCEPILAHMLNSTEMDENPMLNNPAIGKTITSVYEDEYLAVINKPAEFLSVPGKNIKDCVYTRMQQKYPNATGPLLVHRLDMSTSGLLLIAKSKEVHKKLQSQFIKRSIKKRYTALLNGIVEGEEGLIDLPLCVDMNDRPRQLVCYEHGKAAQTKWKVIERKNQQTKIHFFPITGRTHQLRVHAAHPQGLNIPIVGDDLYGTRAERLHLHAEWLEFQHPISDEIMSVAIPAAF